MDSEIQREIQPSEIQRIQRKNTENLKQQLVFSFMFYVFLTGELLSPEMTLYK